MLPFLVAALIIIGIPTSRDELSFSYRAFGGDDQIDQFLTIHNDGLHAVAPRLKFTPLDANHQPIPGLTVTTAYGSERGEQVVPALWDAYDILHFEGDRAGDVRDVRVDIAKLKQVRYPDLRDDVTVDRYEGDRKVDFNDFDAPFDRLKLTNPNGDAVTVKIVLIGWAAAKKGDPQQFEWAIPIGPAVKVPAQGAKVVPLPGDLADISRVSVKTYAVTS